MSDPVKPEPLDFTDRPCPRVSVVVIGRNEGARLARSLSSVEQTHWGTVEYECIYIDSGSTDQSVALATGTGVQVRVLEDPAPCAAKARNLGLRCAQGEFVMFLDGDSELHPDFILRALATMDDPQCCAVSGLLRERDPDQSIFTAVMDLDWIQKPGPQLFFGGNVLTRRACLNAVGGFDPLLTGGEEPELSARLRAKGWRIELIDAPMARHDLAITSFGAYWKRAYRSGIVYAEIAHRMRQSGDSLWQYESQRDLIQGLILLGMPLIAVIAWLVSPTVLFFLLCFAGVIFARSVSRCAWKAPNNRLLCWQYVCHSFFAKIPAVLGQLSWHRAHRHNQPLRLVEYKEYKETNSTNKVPIPTSVEKDSTVNVSNSPRMGYLISTYPATSHTFILREVQQLRALGHTILTASINLPDQSYSLQNSEQRCETDQTFYVKAAGWSGALQAIAYWLVRPESLFKMIWTGACLSIQHGSLIGIAYAIEAAMVARWMHLNSLHALHVHFGNAAATVGIQVKQLSGCHLSLTIHGPDEFDEVSTQHLKQKIAAADAIICISQFVKSQLMRLSAPKEWAKLQVCRLGVEPLYFAYHPRPPQIENLRLLCVGRLTPAKCQVLLVEACAKLRARGHTLQLTLVGSGPDLTRIEQTITAMDAHHYVSMTGAINENEVRKQLEIADIFVLPSLAEGIPVVLMEAMSCGLPCVSTYVNGIPELITHGQSGLLVAPGDVDQLVVQLEQLIIDPILRQRLAAAGRQQIETNFDLTINVQKLGNIFDAFGISRGTGRTT